MTTLSTILEQIDNGTVLLPDFQRGYVWNREQVRGLMRSLYLGYPVGSLLVWETDAGDTTTRGSTAGSGMRSLLLDGQQRITSLYGVARGEAPPFFEGDPSAFLGLRFHIGDESFEFHAPAKMANDPLWLDVTDVFKCGLEPSIAALTGHEDFAVFMSRLARLHGILQREFHQERITGPDKTVDVVVDIFNRVNSGGTKLSKGDLALAKLTAASATVRPTIRRAIADWDKAGYRVSQDWVLRNATAVATGRAPFSSLDGVAISSFEQALARSVKHVNTSLNLIGSRLGLDHDRVFMGRYAIPVLSRYLEVNGGTFADQKEQNLALYWYVNAALWGRYSGTTESTLAQDYETVAAEGIPGLISNLAQARGGNLRINPSDFSGYGVGARFYPLLYLLTRTGGAKDLGTGVELKATLLGHLASLQVHHLFPKARLYEHDYTRGEVNAVANFALLTQESNLAISARRPVDYFEEVAAAHPGALESQWIPVDRELWEIENYRDFLSARRVLLTDAANAFLDGLLTGHTTLEALAPVLLSAGDEDPETTSAVTVLVAQLRELGVVEPEVDVEIADPETGTSLAVAEAYWPDGLQPGRGSAVILDLDPIESLQPRLQELGYEVFTSPEALLGFVHRQLMVDAGLAPVG